MSAEKRSRANKKLYSFSEATLMKLYEYQARSLFETYGIPIAKGDVASDSESAHKIARNFNERAVIKAQVLVGGRGKAGGVKVAQSQDQVRELTDRIISMEIKSIPVKKVLITEVVEIKKEYYLSLTVDRSQNKIILILSPEGGIDIEVLAAESPDKIKMLPIDSLVKSGDTELENFLKDVFLERELLNQALKIVHSLYTLFIDKDCSLVEINPLALTNSGSLVALDAKIIIDDNSLYKHPELESFRNSEEYSSDELEAREYGLSFVNLDGNIGCIVNGAGLAMATMDLIKLFGGSPANFLDVGGSSSPEKVYHAFEILTRNKNIKAVLINIFGGITRCDDIAAGILQAKEKMELSLPLVIRLIGTNEKRGRSILEEAGISTFEDLVSAVKKVVQYSD